MVCHFTAQFHTFETDSLKQLEILGNWLERLPEAVVGIVEDQITTFFAQGFTEINFFNNVSSLYVVEFLLANHNSLPPTTLLSATQEENFFKLYLHFSSQWTTEQDAFYEKNKYLPKTNWILPLMLPYAELFEFKDFRLQFIKAIYFFRGCENHAEFQGYLQTFLQTLQIPTWQEYLVRLITIYIGSLDKLTNKTLIQFKTEDLDVFNSIQYFFIALAQFEAKKDFLEIREKPLYQYSDDEVLVLSNNFFIDKIYQGVVFDFATTLIKAKEQYNGKPIGSIKNFLGIFGDVFVEQNLFYAVLRSTFSRDGYVHFTGVDLKNQLGDGCPDYLIIDKHKIYVFEFKNAVFSAASKYSYNQQTIFAELTAKFVQDPSPKAKPKGVGQLVNFLDDALRGRYRPLLGENTSAYTFYPLLVTTDFSFNLPTINNFLNSEFTRLLREKALIHKLQIQPVVQIDLDTLIKFQDLFKTMRLTLHDELDQYQEFLDRQVDEIDKMASFHKFIHFKTHTWKYDTPEIFFTEIKPLIDE